MVKKYERITNERKKSRPPRASKKYSFTFNDKEYTTRYKEETVVEHKKKFQKKKK